MLIRSSPLLPNTPIIVKEVLTGTTYRNYSVDWLSEFVNTQNQYVLTITCDCERDIRLDAMLSAEMTIIMRAPGKGLIQLVSTIFESVFNELPI